MKAWPIAAFAGGAVALAAFALLDRVDPALYTAILDGWGVTPFRFPFLDTHAVLSALQCTARGFDTYQANPCDVLTRAFVYSPMILDAAAVRVALAWTDGIGIALAIAFFIAVASLPAPRGGREWAVMTAACFSTMSVFAIERGNIDVLIFVLMASAVHLVRGRPAARGAGYAVIVFAALLKYYPIVAMIAALRERPRRFLAIAALSAAVGALFLAHYWHGLHEAMTRVPGGSYFTDFFGAANLAFGLATLLSPLAEKWPASTPFLAVLPWLILALLIASCVRQALAILAGDDPLKKLSEPRALFLVVGAIVIASCFLAGQSIDYRGIFFLMLLPGLLTLARLPEGGQRFGVTVALIVFLMWGELPREALHRVAVANPMAAAALQIVRAVFWLVRELVWWRVIGVLVGVVACFVRNAAGAYLQAEPQLPPQRGAAR